MGQRWIASQVLPSWQPHILLVCPAELIPPIAETLSTMSMDQPSALTGTKYISMRVYRYERLQVYSYWSMVIALCTKTMAQAADTLLKPKLV